jgi:hypothetical protein
MYACDLHKSQIVSAPGWNKGRPVRIDDATWVGDKVSVRFQDARCHFPAKRVTVESEFEVYLVGGAR